MRLSVEQYQKGILNGDRVVLAKAITLAESTLPQDQQIAGEVVHAILPHTGKAIRLGITGSPGVGKSTFIEAFGKTVLASGKRLAVLTIDPTSQLTAGSILGDKTRMQELARDTRAFIRPSPSGATLGGVATHTRETMLLCEAAGFDFIIVETVGTGQSEVAIKHMVDFFLLLVQPGAGDELQGIKKGIMEMADAIAITKADGENRAVARAAHADVQQALHLQQPHPSGWTPKVVSCSALTHTGLDEIFRMVVNHQKQLSDAGYLQAQRQHQLAEWFSDQFKYLLSIDPQQFQTVKDQEQKLKELVKAGKRSPRKAAQELLDAYHTAVKNLKNVSAKR